MLVELDEIRPVLLAIVDDIGIPRETQPTGSQPLAPT